MRTVEKMCLGFALMAAATAVVAPATAQQAKPNILFIMGDDIGWMQPSIYHQGLMVGETPNIDRIGQEGAKFTDYYAEQSCTAGRNAFFTGMHPLRTGMIPPQLPGSPSYLRPGTPALAWFLRDLGYNTGEFGKNHLGDHTDALPNAHGFHEFWGYLYHLDAMQVGRSDVEPRCIGRVRHGAENGEAQKGRDSFGEPLSGSGKLWPTIARPAVRTLATHTPTMPPTTLVPAGSRNNDHSQIQTLFKGRPDDDTTAHIHFALCADGAGARPCAIQPLFNSMAPARDQVQYNRSSRGA
jgi:arylsulfatase A-like enzyme